MVALYCCCIGTGAWLLVHFAWYILTLKFVFSLAVARNGLLPSSDGRFLSGVFRPPPLLLFSPFALITGQPERAELFHPSRCCLCAQHRPQHVFLRGSRETGGNPPHTHAHTLSFSVWKASGRLGARGAAACCGHPASVPNGWLL